MRKLIALVLPFLMLAGVLITLSVFEAQRGADWQIELTKYLAQRQASGEIITVEKVVEASRPENFSPSMGQAARIDWVWSIEEVPMPPTALRCVLLAKQPQTTVSAQTGPAQQVIFIGYHSDQMWRMGWLVYEGPLAPFTPKVVANLDTLGCNLISHNTLPQ